MALNPQMERFVQEYIIDLNATAAAKRAGYSDPNYGRQLITNPNVAKAIQEKQVKLEAKSELSAVWVIEKLRKVAERCMQEVPVMYFDREDKCMKQEVDEETGEGIWTFNAAGANKALELIGKHFGAFPDKLDITGTMTYNYSDRLHKALKHDKAGV